jgi:ActR/RegA family two-component response regulator
MLLQSVILSRDSEKVGILMRALSRLDVDVVVCSDCNSALEVIAQQKFDAVVVDFHLLGSKEALKSIRGQANKKIIVVAIVGEQAGVADAFACGANFVFYEPVTLERAMQSLRAIKNLMYPQRRQHLRKPAYSTAHLKFGQEREVKAIILNVSEGGMAVRLPQPVSGQRSARLRFSLPGTRTDFDIQGELVWVDAKGRAGIRFVRMPLLLQARLSQWLFPALQEGKGRR